MSARLDPAAGKRETRRHVRYAQRAALWDVSSLERVRKCGRVTHGGDGGSVQIAVRRSARAGAEPSPIAHFSGLTTCGSIHGCPVCGAKIRTRRAGDISHFAAAWHDDGNTVVMASFTFPHRLGMRLSLLLDLVSDGFRSVISGRPWRRLRDRARIAGTIRATEITWSPSAGWHPHAHALIFCRGELDACGLAELGAGLSARWGRFITGRGFPRPHAVHGVDLRVCTSAAEAGAYIAKTQDGHAVGHEMARADLKQGRSGSMTPFEILDEFRWTGDVEYLALWHEYEKATRGRQAIAWSKGLPALAGEAELTDEEVAAEEVGGEPVAMLDSDTWHAVAARPGLDAAILSAAEAGGLPAVNELLARHGLGRAHPPLPARGRGS
ncbi:MAG: hypothetical protein ACLQDY_08380 [Streptosporangiaceae bacterium]